MTRNLLAILVCLTFVTVGNSQDAEQTLTADSSFEPVPEEQTLSTGEATSILVQTTDGVEEEAASRLEVVESAETLDATTAPSEDLTEVVEIPEEPMPIQPELLSVTEPASLATPVTPEIETLPVHNSVGSVMPINPISTPQQPLTTLIPSELNRIAPAQATPAFLSCQTGNPALNYYRAPTSPFPIAATTAPVNRYVTVQPMRPLQSLPPQVQQVQVTRYTVYSYNQMTPQPEICQPRMGPIERMFRRFR